MSRRGIPPRTDADRRAAIKAASAYGNSLGVTSIHNAGATAEEVAVFEAARRDLTVRAYVAFWGSAQTTETDADAMAQAWQRLGDDATLRTGLVKLAADGVIESRTAAMLAPTQTAPARSATSSRDRLMSGELTAVPGGDRAVGLVTHSRGV